MKKVILSFILGLIVAGGIGVIAYSYNAKDIEYSPSDSSWNVSTVEGAINELYNQKSINLSNVELIANYSETKSTISVEPQNYQYLILTTVYWDASQKIYPDALENHLAITNITNASSTTIGYTGRNGSKSSTVARSFLIKPDGSGNLIEITHSGSPDATSIYGIK